MHTFSGQEIVRLWEIGISQHPLDRALTLLMAAFPETSRERLALLSIGRRDAYVFALREQTFGSRLHSLAACPAGGEIAGEQLPETLLAAMAAQMDTCDPLAAMNISLDCAACGHQWTLLFDIVSFFWTEITAQAKRLLREVHTLASHYGWREADILVMSAVRRQLYLEMVT